MEDYLSFYYIVLYNPYISRVEYCRLNICPSAATVSRLTNMKYGNQSLGVKKIKILRTDLLSEREGLVVAKHFGLTQWMAEQKIPIKSSDLLL